MPKSFEEFSIQKKINEMKETYKHMKAELWLKREKKKQEEQIIQNFIAIERYEKMVQHQYQTKQNYKNRIIPPEIIEQIKREYHELTNKDTIDYT